MFLLMYFLQEILLSIYTDAEKMEKILNQG